MDPLTALMHASALGLEVPAWVTGGMPVDAFLDMFFRRLPTPRQTRRYGMARTSPQVLAKREARRRQKRARAAVAMLAELAQVRSHYAGVAQTVQK